MIHADGSTLNTTDLHRWAIHSNPPGKDFYDWQGRCLSTNQVFNPYKVWTFLTQIKKSQMRSTLKHFAIIFLKLF